MSCENPEPKFPLLTEQRALVRYMEAISTLHHSVVVLQWPISPMSLTLFISGTLDSRTVSLMSEAFDSSFHLMAAYTL